MIVTWATLDRINESYVEYGINTINMVEVGITYLFIDGGSQHRNITMHRVVLSNLKPEMTYKYHCGSPKYGWSPVFFFTSMPTREDWSPRFAVFGDLGNINGQSISRLQEETMLGYYDLVLHVGDFAYDMDTVNFEFIYWLNYTLLLACAW